MKNPGRIVAIAALVSAIAAGGCGLKKDSDENPPDPPPVFPGLPSTLATTAVSIIPSWVTTGNDGSVHARISADGRYVVFDSMATNLVPGDSAGFLDIFRFDLQDGSMDRISIGVGGAEPNQNCYDPHISDDGRYVAYAADANNLIVGDTNGADIFVRDTVLNTTIRASVDNASGAEQNAGSYVCAISGNGRYVAFESDATNLVTGDTNSLSDIFVRDLQANTTIRVSVDSAGAQATGGLGSRSPTISSDGRYVAFASSSTNLVASDNNGLKDCFVRDTVGSTTTRVSVDNATGAQATGGISDFPIITPDGRYVLFTSAATNLVTGDSNGLSDAFVRDQTGLTTIRVSLNAGGGQITGGNWIFGYSITPDGRYVGFSSDSATVVGGDTNGQEDAFVRDMVGLTTVRVSVSTAGAEAVGGGSYAPMLSADGRWVAFVSWTSNIITNDANAFEDVFVRGPLH